MGDHIMLSSSLVESLVIRGTLGLVMVRMLWTKNRFGRWQAANQPEIPLNNVSHTLRGCSNSSKIIICLPYVEATGFVELSLSSMG